MVKTTKHKKRIGNKSLSVDLAGSDKVHHAQIIAAIEESINSIEGIELVELKLTFGGLPKNRFPVICPSKIPL